MVILRPHHWTPIPGTSLLIRWEGDEQVLIHRGEFWDLSPLVRAGRILAWAAIADRLCAAARNPTLTRHDISRWERGGRVPGRFWLGWLSTVLAVPIEELVDAALTARRQPDYVWQRQHRWWRAPAAAELLAMLDTRHLLDLRPLARTWLAGPPVHDSPLPTVMDIEPVDARLDQLRRLDDRGGGPSLATAAEHVARQLIQALSGRPAGTSASPPLAERTR